MNMHVLHTFWLNFELSSDRRYWRIV